MAYADKFPVSMKKGGNMMKTAGKTTTGVISDYRGYTGKKQLGGIKKAVGAAKKVYKTAKKVANKIGSKKMY